GRGGDLADRDRVRAAAVPDEEPEAGAEQGPDPRPGLELRLRRPGERRRALHLLPAQEDRCRPRADDPHDARRAIRAQAGHMRSLSTRLVLTAVALVVVISALIGVAATFAIQNRLIKQVDAQLEETIQRLGGREDPGNTRPGTVVAGFPDPGSQF